MRLIIDLDYKIRKYISENDIILTNDFLFLSKYRNKNNIILINSSLEDENIDLSNSINSSFEKLPREFLKFRNSYYARVLRPINAIISQIDFIAKKYGINEILLYGGNDDLNISLHFTEGEGTKWLYKSSWLFNPAIATYFSNYDHFTIKWIKKDSRIKLRLILHFREQVLFWGEIFTKCIRSIFMKGNFKEAKYTPSLNDINTIVICNLQLQYNHLSKLVSRMTKLKPLYIIRDNIVTDKNIDKISLSSISCKEIVSIIHQSNKNMAHKIDEISFTIHSHKFFIKTNRFIKSLRLLNFQMNYQLRMLIHTIDSLDLSKCKYLITDMTYGQDIIVSNTIANHFKYLHYNFQYVAMSKMLYPQMDLADKYFLYSKKTFELYKKYSDKYYLYFPSNRNILYNNLSKKINMVLFTQPDSYTDRYLYFISLLLPLIEQNKLSVNLSIKMHYRQDKISLFNKMIEGCTNARISNPNETVESLILENDIILSMTSSVLFESLTLGKMGVIIDFDGIDSNIIYNNDLCYPDVNFVIKSIEDLSYILQNFSMYIELFKERYNKFKNTFGEYVNYDTIFDE